MKLEYDYRIGSEGLEFTLPPDRQTDPRLAGDGDNAPRIERFIMQCWQEAINACFPDPQQLAELMATAEGQAQVSTRATAHLSVLLENFPRDLDRRNRSDRRSDARSVEDRRKLGRRPRLH